MLALKTFDFESDIILENERVLLRPLAQSDGSLLAHFVEEEPDLWKYSLVAINNGTDLENYIQTAIEARVQKTSYAFIVFDKLLNEYVGCTRFYDIPMPNGKRRDSIVLSILKEDWNASLKQALAAQLKA